MLHSKMFKLKLIQLECFLLKAVEVYCKGTKIMNQNVEKNAKFKAAAATFVNDNELDETEVRACQGGKKWQFFGKFS